MAAQLYNLAQGFALHPSPKTQSEYWPLPLIDQWAVTPPPPPDEWWEKMQAHAKRAGYKFPTD